MIKFVPNNSNTPLYNPLFLIENAATPYAATVSINDMQYGIGYGTSKKQAKSEAARATLEILIPEMKSKITTDAKTGSSASRDQDQDLSVILFFLTPL